MEVPPANHGRLVRAVRPEKEKDMPNQMLATHPIDTPNEALGEVIRLLGECAETCTICADACLAEEMVADLRACIRLNLDCADVCAATSRVLARQNGREVAVINALLRSCAEACAACATECEQHAEMHEHCRICAEACRRCEQACLELLAGQL